jgi:colicin import membrane protein
MAGIVREHAGPLVLSVLLHATVIGLLAFGVWNLRPKPAPKPQLALEATVVDESAIEREMQKLEDEERQREQQRREEQERAEQLRRERETEEQRLEEIKKQREQEEEAERLRVAEQAKAVELAAKQKKEQDAKATAEKKRKADESRLKKEREAELKRRLAEEERRDAAVGAGLLEQYIAQIQARVQRNWNRPVTARPGINCVVHVTQVPGGEVVGVRVGECNGDDSVRASIEAAVLKASPLPEPPDPALFERNLRLEFKPDE